MRWPSLFVAGVLVAACNGSGSDDAFSGLESVTSDSAPASDELFARVPTSDSVVGTPATSTPGSAPATDASTSTAPSTTESPATTVVDSGTTGGQTIDGGSESNGGSGSADNSNAGGGDAVSGGRNSNAGGGNSSTGGGGSGAALEAWCADADVYITALEDVLAEEDPAALRTLVTEYQELGDRLLERAPGAIADAFAVYRNAEDQLFGALAIVEWSFEELPPTAFDAVATPEFEAADGEVADYFDNTCVPILDG